MSVGLRESGFFFRTALRRIFWAVFFCNIYVSFAAAIPEIPGAEPQTASGFPLARFYSFDEIGPVSRGATLGFDYLGRFSVTYQGHYMVLNDSAWLDLYDHEQNEESLSQVNSNSESSAYYGSIGSWGMIEKTTDGKMRQHSWRPKNCPNWVSSTNFNHIEVAQTGVYFSGWSGVVYYDFITHLHHFFAVSDLLCVFSIKNRLFVSSRQDGLLSIDPSEDISLRPIAIHQEGVPSPVDRAATLSDGRIILSTISRQLLVFDGLSFLPWAAELNGIFSDRILALQSMADGSLAAAIRGKGVVIIGRDGNLLSTLDSPEYTSVRELAAREPGTLWIATDAGIYKVLYGSAVTVVDQRLGVPVAWPQVVSWEGQTIIASGGRLFRSKEEIPGVATRFKMIRGQPRNGSWAIAANGNHLLTGNSQGVFEMSSDGTFTQILSGLNTARLAMPNPNLCYVLGASEITVLEFVSGKWQECTERRSAPGYPNVVHTAKNSVWVELGANRAARLSLKKEGLDVRVFNSFPWESPRWVNISVIDDTIVMTGPEGGRLFFNESDETITRFSWLSPLLDRSPFWVIRVARDENGTLWASHKQGVLKILDARSDVMPVDVIKGGVQSIQVFDHKNIWLSTGTSLYHINPSVQSTPDALIRPVLVSVRDARSGKLILTSGKSAELGKIPYLHNSLSLRFFAGSYTIPAPLYEFRIDGDAGSWTILGGDSLLTLPNLKEGDYNLEVRLANNSSVTSAPLSLHFTIFPPWYRTLYSNFIYVILIIFTLNLLFRFLSRRTRTRNIELEVLIEQRTAELRGAMEQLNEETRNAATIAERVRLAGEIHDSVQQGLIGLMLQLDSTLNMPRLAGDVKARLSVARNMLSFTREEVQHVLWNMESCLIENANLVDALDKLATLISSGTIRVENQIIGNPKPLSSSITHHLLRIAQETITNSIRHGEASQVELSLTYSEEAVILCVKDKGKGFAPEHATSDKPGHFGLRGVRSRAAKIGGIVEMISEVGRGTCITVSVPTILPTMNNVRPHESAI